MTTENNVSVGFICAAANRTACDAAMAWWAGDDPYPTIWSSLCIPASETGVGPATHWWQRQWYTSALAAECVQWTNGVLPPSAVVRANLESYGLTEETARAALQAIQVTTSSCVSEEWDEVAEAHHAVILATAAAAYGLSALVMIE